jgi:hypothetical protein
MSLIDNELSNFESHCQFNYRPQLKFLLFNELFEHKGMDLDENVDLDRFSLVLAGNCDKVKTYEIS